MPKGVEHEGRTVTLDGYTYCVESLMPKGVEHEPKLESAVTSISVLNL